MSTSDVNTRPPKGPSKPKHPQKLKSAVLKTTKYSMLVCLFFFFCFFFPFFLVRRSHSTKTAKTNRGLEGGAGPHLDVLSNARHDAALKREASKTCNTIPRASESSHRDDQTKGFGLTVAVRAATAAHPASLPHTFVITQSGEE